MNLMNLKPGDILIPTDLYLHVCNMNKHIITGMLIFISSDSKLMSEILHFYQINKHKHDWHYTSWIDGNYKVLQ